MTDEKQGRPTPPVPAPAGFISKKEACRLLNALIESGCVEGLADAFGDEQHQSSIEIASSLEGKATGWIANCPYCLRTLHFRAIEARDAAVCNCAHHTRGQLTAGWKCPIHGQQW